MMTCPHCKRQQGHYSVVQYRCIDSEWYIQDHWFCHTCARLVYEDEQDFVMEE
jgi:hypothetical protein